ncbi:ApaG [Gracilaria domingensis]|nr:ApaG [Gracilaria domingensis]
MAFLSPFDVSSRISRRRPCPLRCAAAGVPNSASEGSDNSARPDVAARRLARVRLFRQLDELQHSLNAAVKRERFADAARLRDEIASLRLSDEYCRTEMALMSAVKEERFADAARLRDALKDLEPPPSLQREYEKVVRAGEKERGGEVLSNVSVTNSHRICVRAEGYYIPEQSVPEHNRFLFGYKIVITNESEHVCQLVSRHWIISSDGNADSHVKGAGVRAAAAGAERCGEPEGALHLLQGGYGKHPLHGERGSLPL